jgi:glutathione-dependent peroxiredoxin
MTDSTPALHPQPFEVRAPRTSRVGMQIPDVELVELIDAKVVRLRSVDLFRNRRTALFALPGAFTPTCSSEHVPGYVRGLSQLQDAGIAEVICLSVNDPYVMEAWQRAEKAQSLRFISDPYGEFTAAMGMLVDNRDASLGKRSWRYSMLVDNGVVEAMFVEREVPGDPFEVSGAETMMKYLRPGYETPRPAFMLARHGCPHCARAKQLLKDRGIPFEAVHLGEEFTMQGVKAASGSATVPQVFIDGVLIGGADQLTQYFSSH